MLGGALVLGAAAFFMASTGVGFAALPFMLHAMEALAVGGISMEAGAAAAALSSNRGTGITIRQAAAYRQIIRGTRRVPGVIIFRSTTGGRRRQLNYVIVLAAHECWAITGLYLDGRLVYFENGVGTTTRNGYTFGGAADGVSRTGPNGVKYNFGGLVYCEARYGDQVSGDVIGGLTANDPTWAATPQGSPYVGGCTYFYLKIEGDSATFPSEPEIKVTTMGKPVYDPRTGQTAYTSNWALHVADHISDPTYGVGDPYVNEAQLIAAANVCDEQIPVQQLGGTTEARYSMHWNYETSLSPGNVLVTMMEGAAGRVRQIGGEWWIFPAYWQGPSAAFDHNSLAGPIDWNPNSGIDGTCNVVTGTYIAPNYPFNVTGNLYDSNGFYEGQIQNNFPFAYQPTNFPQYARDTGHGYASNVDLDADSGVQGPWDATKVYSEGDVTSFAGSIWVSLVDANLNNAPATATGSQVPSAMPWALGALYLPMDVQFETICSVTQAQRVAKIMLMRKRFNGKGKLPLKLGAYSMQSLDVMQFTAPEIGWAGKVLEIDQPVLRAVEMHDADGEGGESALQVLVPIMETDPSIYEWDPATEEQTVYNVQATPQNAAGPVVAPTNLAVVSTDATALVQPDGSVQQRLEVTYDTPLDQLASGVQTQYRLTPVAGATVAPWLDGGTVDISLELAYLSPVLAGQSYDVRIRTVRPNSAASDWVEVDGTIADLVYGAQSGAIGQGSLTANAPNLSSTDNIVCSPFMTAYGSQVVSYFPGGSVTLSGLQKKMRYFVYVVDPTLAGGNLTPVATLNQADYLGKSGYFLIDSIATP